MHPISFLSLFSVASAIPTLLSVGEVDNNLADVIRKDISNINSLSTPSQRSSIEPKPELDVRDVYFSQSYDWPSAELLVHAGRYTFFSVSPNSDGTYAVYFFNLGPANGSSAKFVFTTSSQTITDVVAGGADYSDVYTVTKSGTQFSVEASVA